MKRLGVVMLVFALILSFGLVSSAGEVKKNLKDINYKISAEIVNLEMDMESGDLKIVTKSPNYSGVTLFEGKSNYTMLATAGELKQLDKKMEGVFDSVTKIHGKGVKGLFAVKMKGKGRAIFKHLLLERAKQGKVTVLIKGDGTGTVIISVPDRRKRGPRPPALSWMTRFMQMKSALDLTDNEIWDILHEYGVIAIGHALEHTPPKQGDRSLWYFWLYLLKPEVKASVQEENNVVARLFHPKTGRFLPGLRVNVSISDFRNDLGLVYAATMPYYGDTKMYIRQLEVNHNLWIIPPDQLDPGEYTLHIDVCEDMRKFVKIPIIITDDGTVIEKTESDKLRIDFKPEGLPDTIEAFEIRVINPGETDKTLGGELTIIREGETLGRYKIPKAVIKPGGEREATLTWDQVTDEKIEPGNYLVLVSLQSGDLISFHSVNFIVE